MAFSYSQSCITDLHNGVNLKRDGLTAAGMGTLLDDSRGAEELRDMLLEAEERKRLWEKHFKSEKMSRKSNAEAIRNITALRGVIKTLRWVLNLTDENGIEISHPLD